MTDLETKDLEGTLTQEKPVQDETEDLSRVGDDDTQEDETEDLTRDGDDDTEEDETEDEDTETDTKDEDGKLKEVPPPAEGLKPTEPPVPSAIPQPMLEVAKRT